MFFCCECCILSGRGLCDELITRPEESYRLWCVVVCDLETSRMRRPWPALGRSATEKKIYVYYIVVVVFSPVIVQNLWNCTPVNKKFYLPVQLHYHIYFIIPYFSQIYF